VDNRALEPLTNTAVAGDFFDWEAMLIEIAREGDLGVMYSKDNT